MGEVVNGCSVKWEKYIECIVITVIKLTIKLKNKIIYYKFLLIFSVFNEDIQSIKIFVISIKISINFIC